MNANRLAKHLDGRLTPGERLGLFYAAHVRGDLAQRDRLTREAPTEAWALPDFYPLSSSWFAVATLQFIRALDLVLAARRMRAAAEEPARGAAAQARMAACADLAGYLLLVHARAWRRLGREHGIDALALWRDLPGWDQLREELGITHRAGLTPARAAAALRGTKARPDGGRGRVRTVRSVLAEMRAEFDAFTGSWKDPTTGGPADLDG